MQALEHGQKINQRQLHYKELGIAALSSYFVNANKDPKKGKKSKPSDFYYFAIKEGVEAVRLNTHACNSFFSLIKDNKLPVWVMGVAPFDHLRTSKDDGFVPKRRALVSDTCLILNYTIFNGAIYSPLSFIGSSHGITIVKDADSSEEYTIDTSEFSLNATVIDGEYKVNG